MRGKINPQKVGWLENMAEDGGLERTILQFEAVPLEMESRNGRSGIDFSARPD